MYVVYNEKDYEIGKGHFIDKDVIYTILNEDTGKTSTLKGISLIAKIRKDIKLSTFTFKNVAYRNRPVGYWDIPLTPQEPIFKVEIDASSGVVQSNNTGLDVSVKFEFEPRACMRGSKTLIRRGSIVINGLVIPINGVDATVHVPDLSMLPYYFYFGSIELRGRVNDSSVLERIVFDNVELDNSLMKFKLCIFAHDCEISHTYTIVDRSIEIDFNNRLMIVGDTRVRLSTVVEYTKKVFLNKDVSAIEFDKFSYLSNYYPCSVIFDGREYDSSEAAYQSMKILDKSERDKFSALSADESRQLGKKIQNSSYLRPDWEQVKFKLMHDIVLAKFSQNTNLRDQLLRTKGASLVEDTTGWCDTIWGRCRCEKCKGKGLNNLGRILTDVRKELENNV